MPASTLDAVAMARRPLSRQGPPILSPKPRSWMVRYSWSLLCLSGCARRRSLYVSMRASPHTVPTTGSKSSKPWGQWRPDDTSLQPRKRKPRWRRRGFRRGLSGGVEGDPRLLQSIPSGGRDRKNKMRTFAAWRSSATCLMACSVPARGCAPQNAPRHNPARRRQERSRR